MDATCLLSTRASSSQSVRPAFRRPRAAQKKRGPVSNLSVAVGWADRQAECFLLGMKVGWLAARESANFCPFCRLEDNLVTVYT